MQCSRQQLVEMTVPSDPGLPFIARFSLLRAKREVLSLASWRWSCDGALEQTGLFVINGAEKQRERPPTRLDDSVL